MIAHLIPSRTRDLGGFSVGRVLPAPERRLVGPFVFFDHLGPAAFAPGQGIDVRPHPHIGLATVTYLFEGGLTHRDSLGTALDILPGAVNWMTAGRGIAHSERSPPAMRASGHVMHGIQSWVALPVAHEEDAPAFVHHPADTLPVIERPGARLVLIAGTAFGETSPVEFAHPVVYLEARLDAGATLVLPGAWGERAVYVVDGAATLDGAPVAPREMAVLADSGDAVLAATGATHAMILGGAPMDGGRHIFWNFVSHSPERIEAAKAEWRAGRFALVPGESEFIPLPEEPAPAVGKGSPTS